MQTQVTRQRVGHRAIFAGSLFSALLGLLFVFAPATDAAVGINQQLNYQGRLLNNTGAVVPDGTYNMEFKIYQDGDGVLGGGDETLKWTETRTGVNKVTVKNGYFSVQLGFVTAFGTSVDWNQDTLWLSTNIGGTGTPTWDGEMSPFRRLGASPYAFNANRLGGRLASEFLQLAPGSVQTDATSNNSIFINKTGGTGNILQLQKNGTDVVSVNNSGLATFSNGLSVATDTITDFTGNGLAVTSNTLNVRLDTTAADGSTVSSVSGLEFVSGELSLLRGCAANEILKWDNVAFEWDCAADQTGGGGGSLQSAYDGGAAGDQVVALDNVQDSVIFRNPAASGTDSGFVLSVDQLNTGAVDGLRISSLGTGALLKITDGTATAADVLTVADGGATTVKSQTNDPNAFRVLNASSVEAFAVDTSIGQIRVNGGGIEFNETDTNPACAAGNYNIFADLSETKLKKCVNGTLSDIDAGTKYETFTANATYTKPTDTVMVIVEAFGPGGGGGGGGSIATATARTGGGAGGGGAYVAKTFTAANIGATETVTVPAGGNGGTGGTNAAGADGSAATADTSFGALLIAYRGGGGANGNNSVTLAGGGGGGGSGAAGTSSTAAAGGAGGGPAGGAANGGTTNIAGNGGGGGGTTAVGQTSTLGGGGGGPSAATTGLAGGSSNRGAGGGGGGGSCAATCANANGGAGGNVPGVAAGGGGAGGTGAGGAGTSGANGTNGNGGKGGGGGASNATAAANGGAGGAGGTAGGGGGGGGAATFSATGTGGTGGAGGRGEVRVWTLRGSGADLAEMYCSNDETIIPGDTISIDPHLRAGVKKTSKAYDPTALGTITTDPGLVIGRVEEQCAKPVLVALSGRVPVKVSLENGPIQPGDTLTPSSTPGVAMKATKAGTIIGQALTAYDGSMPQGFVVAFIKNGQGVGSKLADQIPGLADLEDADHAKKILEYFTARLQTATPTVDLSEITTDRVAAGVEIITPKLTAGSVFTNFIEPSTTAGITIRLANNGMFVIAGEDGEPVMSFDNRGNAYFQGDVEFAGTAIFNDSAAGFAQIGPDQTEVKVTFTKPHLTIPVVTVNIKNGLFAPYSYKDVTREGFTIVLAEPATTTVDFSWTALSVKNPKTTQAASSP